MMGVRKTVIREQRITATVRQDWEQKPGASQDAPGFLYPIYGQMFNFGYGGHWKLL